MLAKTGGKKSVAIVDAYNTGALLAEAFRNRGWKLLHVQSQRTIPARYQSSFRAALFDDCVGVDSVDNGAIVQQVSAWRPDLVIAGSEPGTPLADQLAHRLGLPCNDPASSAARRNKYEMVQALKRKGLAAARTFLAGSVQEAIAAAHAIASWPIVVKPLDSVGSDGFHLCRNDKEVGEAFRALFMRDNALGFVMSQVLIQEFLVGQQYMVNAVSINGRHKITEIWKEDRLNIPGVGNLYDKEMLVPFDGDVQPKLVAYTRNTLDAVGVREGPSHTELMMTGAGPTLIEIGARLQGGIVEFPLHQAIGDSHVSTTLRRYLEPEAFAQEVETGYRLKRTAMVVNLISSKTGTVIENNCTHFFAQLPSFFMVVRTPSVGSRVERTIDLNTKVGHIYLLHDDVKQLDSDYRQIREWEEREKLLVVA